MSIQRYGESGRIGRVSSAQAPVIRIVAGVIFDDAGRMVLVRKRGTDAFMQPGGKFEPGETPQQALVRELNEELGYELDAAELEPMGRFSARAANEPGHLVDCDVFFIRVGSEGVVAAEIEELRWVDPLDLPDLELAPLTSDVLMPLIRERAHGERRTP
ncbi:MAG: 8-oxo-dGTP diphosphatase [Actinomycetota bacterium]|nr:8-oxo-dGTP diphosphatase [Actinomycetota bacterium]